MGELKGGRFGKKQKRELALQICTFLVIDVAKEAIRHYSGINRDTHKI